MHTHDIYHSASLWADCFLLLRHGIQRKAAQSDLHWKLWLHNIHQTLFCFVKSRHACN